MLINSEGEARLAPYLLSRDDVVDFFRLHASGTRFPKASVYRYRRMGLQSVRIGRRVWFPLPSVLHFLETKLERLG